MAGEARKALERGRAKNVPLISETESETAKRSPCGMTNEKIVTRSQVKYF